MVMVAMVECFKYSLHDAIDSYFICSRHYNSNPCFCMHNMQVINNGKEEQSGICMI